jgi:hypothetical protein
MKRPIEVSYRATMTDDSGPLVTPREHPHTSYGIGMLLGKNFLDIFPGVFPDVFLDVFPGILVSW